MSLSQISATAKIADDVEIGPFTVIGDNVEIGAGTVIKSHVVICANTKIGENNHIYSGAVLGEAPQLYALELEQACLVIGDNNIIRENVTIHCGSSKQDGVTKIGSNNFFMCNSHIGHDCIVEDNVLLVNNAALGGHVVVHSHAIIGAHCGVHQFCKIGSYAMLSHGAMVNKDVLPYLMVMYNQAKVVGLNKVGLRRNGFSDKDLAVLKKAYKMVFRNNQNTAQAIEQLEPLLNESSHVQAFIDGLQSSTRGIAR